MPPHSHDRVAAAGVFPLSHVFANRAGKRLSGSAFWDAFRLLLEQTNEALAACEIPLAIEDLGFHDLRSKAGDDAEEDGRDMPRQHPGRDAQALRTPRAQGRAAQSEARIAEELLWGMGNCEALSR